MQQTCKQCGAGFKRWRVASFCSRACSGLARRQPVARTCEQCGGGFTVQPAHAGARFCGRACADAGQSHKDRFECKVCAAEFFWSPSRGKAGAVKYCSIACRNADPDHLARLLRMQREQAISATPNRLETAGYAVLDAIGVAYQRQAPMFDKFVVDALIPEHRIVVQWDGDYWHGNPDRFDVLDARQRRRSALDKSQDAYLKRCGYRVLRFWETTVHRSPAGVAEVIRSALQEAPSDEARP
jgi:very-short-patch-repair endonuclease